MKKIIIIIVIAIALAIVLILINKPKDHQQNTLSGSTESLYDKQATKICIMLKKASSLYKIKKNIEAISVSDSAYWDVYDNILEIKYRSYTSPANLFEIENMFHSYSEMLKNSYSDAGLAQLNKARIDICTEVKKEANILNKQE